MKDPFPRAGSTRQRIKLKRALRFRRLAFSIYSPRLREKRRSSFSSDEAFGEKPLRP